VADDENGNESSGVKGGGNNNHLDSDNAKIGYGEPPKHGQFQKGKSGNPKGRPKGSKNSSTLLRKALDETVVIKEGGRRRKISKREAMYKQLANKVASGDPRSIQLTLNEIRVSEDKVDLVSSGPAPFDEAEQEVIEDLIQRLRRGNEDDDDA
jgi:hypothetical protein